MAEIDLDRLKQALQLLEQQENREREEEETSLSLWQKIRHWKHYDFFAKIFLTACLIGLVHVAYMGFQVLSPFFPALVLEALLNACTATVVFFIATTVVDLSLFVSERVYYNFIKRNGDYSFDYQEQLKELTPWQRTIITTVKYLFYLLVYVLIYKG